MEWAIWGTTHQISQVVLVDQGHQEGQNLQVDPLTRSLDDLGSLVLPWLQVSQETRNCLDHLQEGC